MNNTVEEPQLTIGYDSQLPKKPNKPLKVLSLFSGCGGMDLGFEGGFTVHKNSVNEKINPGIIAEHLDNDLVKLKPTKFETVFANDILIDARNTWVNYFEKRNYSPDIYHVESIVDLVKMHKKGYPVFPEKVDVVTGGFPCQDFSVAGKRKGFKSNKDHKGDLIKDNAPSIETRGKLYMWMKEVIEITLPKITIPEGFSLEAIAVNALGVCNHCKKVNYQREIDPQTLATIRSSGMPKTPVGYFSGLILIGLFFGSAAAAGISRSIKTKKYLESPVAGDVYEIKRKENGKSMYALYRVANVTTDSITFDVNDYEAEGTKGLRKLREQRSDNYSEKVTLARAEVVKMKDDNQISSIERK